MSRKLRRRAEELLRRESGTVRKEPGGRISVCLIYPNTYRLGMSNLGYQGVYTLLNERADVVCERAFLPDPRDMEEYSRSNTPLFALESGRLVSDFDIIAFSVSFENDFPNVLKLLQLARVPLEQSERGPGHPLVVMGGVCSTANPEPLALFMDACFVGEAEEMLDEFMDVWAGSAGRDEALRAASRIEGVYVPSLYEVTYTPEGFIKSRQPLQGAPARVKRRVVKDISLRPMAPSIVTPDAEFADMYLVEAMRGCPHSCGFCLAGHVYNPPRMKPVAGLKEEIKRAAKRAARVGLIGPSLTDYPHAREVLAIEGVDFSITSLRAKPGSAELAALIKGGRSASIAPEAGTDRLRGVINKRISHDDIVTTAVAMLQSGLRRLRLYFMVGLPTEGQADIEAIASLVKEVRSGCRSGGIALTLSVFVPKPFTPFQWLPMQRRNTVRERIAAVRDGLRGVKGVTVRQDSLRSAYMQGFLARADRRAALMLKETLRTADFKSAAKRAGLDPDFYIYRERAFDEPLPWDFIDSGMSAGKLKAQCARLLGRG